MIETLIGGFVGFGIFGVLQNRFCPNNERGNHFEQEVKKEKKSCIFFKSKKKKKQNHEIKRASYYH